MRNRSIAAALFLILCLVWPLAAQIDLATEVDQILQQGGARSDVFDAATLFRLRALLRGAANPEQLRAIENRLVASLESAAPLSAKQDVCRVLGVMATAQSAPALKKLLAQPETTDIACYAIANNSVPELGQAVRETLLGSSGTVTVSLLNLLGQRRDLFAVGPITPFLHCEQPTVVAAAATALGKIGGAAAVTELDGFRKTVPQDQRLIADDAYMRALETLEPGQAIPIWSSLVATKDQSELLRRQALLRLSEQAPQAAWPWLLAALREEEAALQPVAGQALRSLRDKTILDQVTARLPELSPASQTVVVEALGQTLPVEGLVSLLHQTLVRPSALRMLGSRPEPQAAAALLAAALSPDRIEDRPEIFSLLQGMSGQAVTDMILRALPIAPDPWLSDLVKLLLARRGVVPLAPLLERARAGESSARVQAIRALRFAASTGDHAVLMELLTTAVEPETREAIEQTIGDIVSRSPNIEASVEWLLAGLKAAQRSVDRQALLRLLAETGNRRALESVVEAVRDGSPQDREAALRALAQCQNSAALGPLLDLAREPLNDAQGALVLRGAVRLLQEARPTAGTKSEAFRQLGPLAKDPASRKLWLSGLAQVREVEALALTLSSLEDPAVMVEAALSAIEITSNLGPGEDVLVNSAMNRVETRVPNPDLRAQARARIRPARPPLPEVYLDSLPPLKAVSGNDGGRGKPQINRNCIGQPLKLQGVTYEHGVGEHARAELTYALQPGFQRFVGLVGLDDQVARYRDVRGSIVVKVFADDRLLLQTALLRGGGASANLDAVIPTAARTLRLAVEDAGDGAEFDDADFVNAGFLSRSE